MDAGLNILITGASGFLGKELVCNLADKNKVVGVVRSTKASNPELYAIGNIDSNTEWGSVLEEVDVVVHCAAQAHKVNSNDSIKEVNTYGAVKLASAAIAAGVKRFVFISSIGVNGSSTSIKPFDEHTKEQPHSEYAESKFLAELELKRLCENTTMELVIVRPPLVYAGHAPGSFKSLLNIIHKEIPLPFSLVKNQRSMISLTNLVDFIALCVEHPAAANETFLVADREAVSTPQLMRYLAEGMGKKIKLLPFPPKIMLFSAQILRRKSLYDQLCGSLSIDARKAYDLLGWNPPVSAAVGLRQAGADFIKLKEQNL